MIVSSAYWITPLYFVLALFKLYLKDNTIKFLSVELMDSLMKDSHSLKNIATRHKCSLRWG